MAPGISKAEFDALEPEAPASGILKRNDWGDSKWYRIECDCSSSEHGHEVDVEADDMGVTVTIYTESYTPYKDGWWDDIKFRVKTALKVLFTGRITVSTDMIMKEQTAVNYAHTLLSAVEDVKEFKAKQNG